MKRRTFIWTPLLLSLGLSLRPDVHANSALASTRQDRLRCEPLLRCFTNPADAAEVGRRYLTDKPELANVEQLMRDLGLNSAHASDQVATVNDQFEAAKRHDFTVGNTVCLEGWVLSKAEASLCALAYLSSPNV